MSKNGSCPYFLIVNKTRNVILADKAKIAHTPFSRIKGLLGRKGLEKGEGLIIKPCSSIHTFFMQFKIDVIFLDKENKVVAMAFSLPPARIFDTFFRGKLVIELPSGILEKTGTKVGDNIEAKVGTATIFTE